MGMKSVNHITSSARWTTLMYIRIPQLLRLMQSPNLFQVLNQYLHQQEVHINQNQQLKYYVEGFIESLANHGLLTSDEATALPIKITQHEYFNRLVQGEVYHFWAEINLGLFLKIS